jgi:hypothetical protein
MHLKEGSKFFMFLSKHALPEPAAASRQSLCRAQLSVKIRSAKTSLPRAVYRTLGKAFAGKARNKKNTKKN